jgi:hypothetical protein
MVTMFCFLYNNSSLSANIRLTGATINNGSWTPAFTPIRSAVVGGGRGVRPETKMIHIPQTGAVTQVNYITIIT